VTTTLSGTAFAPNGTLALYNVIVYVPNALRDPIPQGASCDKCGAQVSGSPVVTTLTDATGKFSLKNVPSGKNIPLVIQVGKWRRQVTIPNVDACKETKLTDPELTRLPKSSAEGSIPKIAVTTGGCDPLGCILPKIGIAATAAKTPAALAAIETYANGGGRIFGSHYHYYWFQHGSAAFQSTAQWQGDGMAPSGGAPYKINTSFPKGAALADWLTAQGVTPHGEMPLSSPSNDVGTVTASKSTAWVTNSAASSTKYLSFNTAVGAAEADQCGKVVYGDMHISTAGGTIDNSLPAGCSKTLSPQEKALAFLFFDLSSCIQPDGAPPMPPPVK
jgi:hypothetical protein